MFEELTPKRIPGELLRGSPGGILEEISGEINRCIPETLPKAILREIPGE